VTVESIVKVHTSHALRLLRARGVYNALTLLTARLPQYPIIGAYPNAQTDGGYRNAFGDGKNIGDPGFIMTGPACAAAAALYNQYAE